MKALSRLYVYIIIADYNISSHRSYSYISATS